MHGCESCCRRPDFPGREPQSGDIALCGVGILGIVSSAKKRKVTYPDGNNSVAWTGHKYGGGEWSSRNPCIIGKVSDWDIAGETFARFVERLLERTPEGWPK